MHVTIKNMCWWFLLVAHMVKILLAMWETRVQSLGRKYFLEKEMETHSSILSWKISWMEEPGRLQFMGSQRVGHDWATNTFTSRLHIVETWFEAQSSGSGVASVIYWHMLMFPEQKTIVTETDMLTWAYLGAGVTGQISVQEDSTCRGATTELTPS